MSRRRPRVWTSGVLVTISYFCVWGEILATRGLSLQARSGGLGAADPRFALALLMLGLTAAASLALVASAVRELRRKRLPAAVGGQLTGGAMLTLVTLGAALNRDHAAAIRAAYAELPATTALVACLVLATFALLLYRLGRTPAAPGIAAVGLVVSAADVLALLAPLPGSRDPGDGLIWGGDVALAILAAEAVVAVGVWRAWAAGGGPRGVVADPLT